MEAVWLPHPHVWGTKIICIPIALRLAQINGPHSLEWAHMCRMKLCSIICWLPASFVYSVLGSWGFPLGERGQVTCRDMQGDIQLATCMAHRPLNKGTLNIPTAPHIFFFLLESDEPVQP